MSNQNGKVGHIPGLCGLVSLPLAVRGCFIFNGLNKIQKFSPSTTPATFQALCSNAALVATTLDAAQDRGFPIVAESAMGQTVIDGEGSGTKNEQPARNLGVIWAPSSPAPAT